MNNIVVKSMRQDFSPSEFSQLMNEAKPIFEISTESSFFDIRIFNNLLLIHEKQYYCKDNKNRYSLDLVLESIQNKLHKSITLLKERIDESMCEIDYYYIFYLN